VTELENMKKLNSILLLESEDWVEIWAGNDKVYEGHGVFTSLDVENILKQIGHPVNARLGHFEGAEFQEDA
jgi:hypothetical protein